MAGSEKSNSNAETKKKSSALAEDFGKDFLSFWGSPKKGKDRTDFDMEEVPKNKKKPFNFDNDDFELGGDFGKLPNFKMDMADLDFSSPDMSNGKPTEKPTEKQESGKEKFSFNFDFNELDKFELDSNPAESTKKPSSFKHSANHDSKSNSGTSTDLSKDLGKSKSIIKDSATTKHENLMDSKPSISKDLELDKFDLDSNTAEIKKKLISFKHTANHDSKRNSGTSTDLFKDLGKSNSVNKDRATSKPENVMDTKSSTSHNLEHTVKSQELPISAVKQTAISDENKNEAYSGEGHKEQAKETCFARMTAEKTTQDFILQSVSHDCSAQEDNQQFAVKADSAKEQNGSMKTVDSSHTRNSSPENSYNSRYRPETRMTESLNDNSDLQKDCKRNQNEDTNEKEVIHKSNRGQVKFQNAAITDFSVANRTKNTGEKQNLGSNIILSPRQRSSTTVIPKSLNDRLAASLHYGREWKQNHEHAEALKVGISKQYGEGSLKGISNISKTERENGQSYSSRFQLSTSNLQQKPATPSLRSSKTVTVEINDISLKDKRANDNRLTISSINKLNCNVPNSMPQEEKPVRYNARSLEFPLKKASKTASSILPEKSEAMTSFSKRKTFEVPPSDPEKLKSLKHGVESANERKLSEISQKVERIEVPVTEKLKAGLNDNWTEDVSEVEDHLKDGKVEKAKQPGDISSAKQNAHKEMNWKETLSREQDNSMRRTDNSQSRNTSPNSSTNSRLYGDERQKEDTGEKEVLSELNDKRLGTQIDSSREIIKHKQDAHREAIPSPLQRSSRAIKSVTMKDKVTAAIQFKTLGKSVENTPPTSLVANDRELSFDTRNLRALNASPITENRFKYKASSLQQQTIQSTTAKSTSPSLTILNNKMQKSGTMNEMNSAKFSQSNSGYPLKTARMKSVTEKSAAFVAPMKRKTFEDSTNDPQNLYPLKRVMESPSTRKPIESSPRTESAMVPVTEIWQVSHPEECTKDLNSNNVHQLGGLTTGIGLLAPFEKDEIAEKAEAYSKELDDMCARLGKQHEEARELLVRAVVNNNTLLMLKHPLRDEKIRSLQKFATGLQSKKF